MGITHAKVSTEPDDSDASAVQPSDWNAAHAFAGGALGSLLYRDTGASDGASWLADVAVGQVLISGGVGAAPAWSANPTVSNLTCAKLTPSGSAHAFDPADGSYDVLFEASSDSAVANFNLGHVVDTVYTTGHDNLGVGLNAAYRITTGIGNLGIGHSALSSMVSGNNNVAIGWDTQMNNISGLSNTSVGLDALKAVTGSFNTAMGDSAALYTTSGTYNQAFGVNALKNNTDGGYNTAIGHAALAVGTSPDQNVAVGDGAIYNANGTGNTAIGFYAGLTTTGSGNVFIGYYAGYYETGDNAFYLDNRNRTNTAGDKAGALLYGTFNATPASQTLKINAALTLAFPGAFAAGDKYLVVDASGNVHVSALGPAS